MGGDDYDSYDEADLSGAEDDDEEERKGIEVDMAEMVFSLIKNLGTKRS